MDMTLYNVYLYRHVFIEIYFYQTICWLKHSLQKNDKVILLLYTMVKNIC